MRPMKLINTFAIAILAGVATFITQHEVFPARAHAASFVVPMGADWREQMLDRYPGGRKVDRVVARLSDRLDLSTQQTTEARAILEQHHERMLALLVASPSTMTRDQFVVQERALWVDTRRQLDAVLTPEQLALVRELGPAPHMG